MYKLAVFGNPIEHSLSPLVFELFAKQFNINLNYSKVLALDESDFKIKVNHFFSEGGLAINITSPFKRTAYETAMHHTIRSGFCKASNFILKQEDGQLLADTTDGIGLIQDIVYNKQFKLNNKKILIIGSGFVLDSVLLDLITHNPAQIAILARNFERTNHLAKQFAVTVFDPSQSYDIVLNTTPNLPENQLFTQIKLLSDGALCYDLTYTKDSIFLKQMRLINSTICGYNGLGMLVEQAKIAFETLFNYQPDSALTLRQLLNSGYTSS